VSDDIVMRLLKQVKSGEVTIEDARGILDGVKISEDEYIAAIDHGVFDEPEAGSIVRSTISTSSDSWLVTMVFVWGLAWTLYWSGSLSYGLINGWDQQLLALGWAMTFTTLIIMGIVYLRWVMPDTVVVKYRRNKYIPENDPEGWVDYKI